MSKGRFLLFVICLTGLLACSLFFPPRTPAPSAPLQSSQAVAFGPSPTAPETRLTGPSEPTSTHRPAQPPPTRTLAGPPGLTPTPGGAAPAVDLPGVIGLSLGGGGLPSRCAFGDRLQVGPGPPVIDAVLKPDINNAPLAPNMVDFCLYSFPMGELVEIHLFDPAGRDVGSRTYRVIEDAAWIFQAPPENPPTFVGLLAWLPFRGAPEEWRLTARSASAQAELFFQYGNADPIATYRPPLSGSDPFDARWFAPFHPGDPVTIEGRNYPPNTRLAVGLYGFLGASLRSSILAHTDEAGSFSAQAPADSSLLSDLNLIVPAVSIDESGSGVQALTNGRFDVEPLPPWQPCEDAPVTSFQIGMRLLVNPAIPTRINVRDHFLEYYSVEESQVIARLEPGERVEIISGPVCREGMNYWYVYAPGSGIAGWTSEGNREGAWLVPEG